MHFSDFPYQGEVAVCLFLQSESAYENVFGGNIPISLMIEAATGQEFGWQGAISLNLILQAIYLQEVVLKYPKSAWTYERDPSKHFFVEGQAYDASLEFGLDKSLPIQEGGEYKYDA
jgi:hypothetical protein